MTEQRINVAAARTNSQNVTNDTQVDGLLVNSLNDLLQINRDSVEGYKLAAEHISSKQLKDKFFELIELRKAVVRELTLLVTKHGGEPEESGKLAGIFHRAWINIKSAVTNSDEAILNECILGEKTLKDAYGEILIRRSVFNFSDEILQLLETQAEQVGNTIRQLKAHS